MDGLIDASFENIGGQHHRSHPFALRPRDYPNINPAHRTAAIILLFWAAGQKIITAVYTGCKSDVRVFGPGFKMRASPPALVYRIRPSFRQPMYRLPR